VSGIPGFASPVATSRSNGDPGCPCGRRFCFHPNATTSEFKFPARHQNQKEKVPGTSRLSPTRTPSPAAFDNGGIRKLSTAVHRDRQSIEEPPRTLAIIARGERRHLRKRSSFSTVSIRSPSCSLALAPRPRTINSRSCYTCAMMAADIFRPEQWSSFFLLVGTGAVTLTGLVFVAMSLNLKEIAFDATHRNRAINTLTGLALVFMRCSLVLMGAQDHRSIGAELFVVAGISAGVFIRGYAKALQLGHGLRLSRIIGGTLVHVTEMFGAALFFLEAVFYFASAPRMLTGTIGPWPI